MRARLTADANEATVHAAQTEDHQDLRNAHGLTLAAASRADKRLQLRRLKRHSRCYSCGLILSSAFASAGFVGAILLGAPFLAILGFLLSGWTYALLRRKRDVIDRKIVSLIKAGFRY